MRTIVRLCDRWDMAIDQPDGGEPWFADWVLRDTKKSQIRISAGWHMFQDLWRVYGHDQFPTVQEFFGGIGAQSLMVRGLWTVRSHIVQEYTQPAVDHMERELGTAARVYLRDAYHSPLVNADLFCLDFGDLTAHKLRPGLPHRQLVDAVFAKSPKAVTLTDVAGRYLHLHRKRYEEALGGHCWTYDDYLESLVDWVERTYGYTMVSGYTNRLSTKMSFVSELLVPRGRFIPTPVEDSFRILEVQNTTGVPAVVG